MRRLSNILPRSSCLAAALIISVACGSATAIAQPATPICILKGPAAAILFDLFKPNANTLVLTAGAGDEPMPVFAARDDSEDALLNGELFSTAPVEGCDLDGGIACCNSAIGNGEGGGEMVLRASYEGEVGWLRMGELCAAPTAVERAGVDFFSVPELVSRELNAQCGVDHCFMEMSDDNGTPLVLVNAPSKNSPLWVYCLMQLADADDSSRTRAHAPAQSGTVWLTSSTIGRSVLGANSPIIPAKHKSSPPPPPKCQSADPAHCNTGSEITYKRCQPNVLHWYKYYDDDEEWCQLTSKCTCP
jgi:hypothetical protein